MRRTVGLAARALLAISFLALPSPHARARQAKAAPKLLTTIAEGLDYIWSPDGRTLAVRDENVSLYDAETGKVKAVVKGVAPPVSRKGVSFTPDGRALAVHADRVRLYDVADGRLLAYTLAEEVTMIGMTVELAKLMVGKLKWKPLPTYVWQLAAN